MKKKTLKPTNAELSILQILWKNGPQTVRQVHESLHPDSDAGYTTTLKLMQIMTEKGLLSRDASQRSHIFTAKPKQEETQRRLIHNLAESAFGGSAMNLVVQALGSSQATQDEIARVRAMLDQMERNKS